MQEIINSGYYLLKEVKLLHGNDGICTKINVNFHHIFLLLSDDYKQRFFIAWICVIERKNCNLYYLKLLKGKMELYVEGQDNKAAFVFLTIEVF